MRRTLMLLLVVALGALVFAPAAFAQDDNPSGDDMGGDDRGGERGFDDNPTGDDVGASATASASPTASASASPRSDDGVLPETGGVALLPAVAGILLVGGGIASVMLLRRVS